MARKIGLASSAGLLIAAAIATNGEPYVLFFIYLGVVILATAYVLARRGLSRLEAGSWLERQHATVGDVISITYTMRNLARLPKPWLEVHSPSTLPVAVPGRVLALGSRTARSWVAKVPLTERGQFRIDPMIVRTGDPFGLFESVATVGPGASLLVYPAVEALPGFTLPPAQVEGAARRPNQGMYLAPLVSSVRPYTTGDAFNRIHWRSSARQQELQVKEFDIEQTADLMLFLDLERPGHTGTGSAATIETAVKVAAAVGAHALADGRGVGIEAVGLRRALITPDRGQRQQQKMLGLLAVAQAEGATPLAEMLLDGAVRPRRGTVATVITPSLDRSWVGPLAALRDKGVIPLAILIDPMAHLDRSAKREGWPLPPPSERQPIERELRALVHALGEHDVRVHVVGPAGSLAEQLVSDIDAPAGRAAA